MEKTALSQKLEYVKQVLATAKQYDHAVNVLMYDQERSICMSTAVSWRSSTA